jgi:hypothetical protein
MVEMGRDRLAGYGFRLQGVDHARRGRRLLFKCGLNVTQSLNKALRSLCSHMARNAAGFRSALSSIESHCASGAMSNGRFRRALFLPVSAKVDETVDDFLARRRLKMEIGNVLPSCNALS